MPTTVPPTSKPAGAAQRWQLRTRRVQQAIRFPLPIEPSVTA